MSKNVKPYNNLQSKKDQVKQMFDNISYKYDFLNQFLTYLKIFSKNSQGFSMTKAHGHCDGRGLRGGSPPRIYTNH